LTARSKVYFTALALKRVAVGEAYAVPQCYGYLGPARVVRIAGGEIGPDLPLRVDAEQRVDGVAEDKFGSGQTRLLRVEAIGRASVGYRDAASARRPCRRCTGVRRRHTHRRAERGESGQRDESLS